MSIYGDIILDHYENPRNYKKLTNPSASVHVNNPLCGDELDIDVVVEIDKVIDIGFSGKGCAISTASASLLTDFVKGKTKDEILALNRDSVLGLLHIDLTPNRLKCALLALEGIQKAITKEI